MAAYCLLGKQILYNFPLEVSQFFELFYHNLWFVVNSQVMEWLPFFSYSGLQTSISKAGCLRPSAIFLVRAQFKLYRRPGKHGGDRMLTDKLPTGRGRHIPNSYRAEFVIGRIYVAIGKSIVSPRLYSTPNNMIFFSFNLMMYSLKTISLVSNCFSCSNACSLIVSSKGKISFE